MLSVTSPPELDMTHNLKGFWNPPKDLEPKQAQQPKPKKQTAKKRSAVLLRQVKKQNRFLRGWKRQRVLEWAAKQIGETPKNTPNGRIEIFEKLLQRKKGASVLGFPNIKREKSTAWIPKSDYEQFYDSREWKELRYLALRNTEGRCECCGGSAKDGIHLHVDHIQPRAARPDLSLALDNLQVLCSDCNIGKGAWDDTDWRGLK